MNVLSRIFTRKRDPEKELAEIQDAIAEFIPKIRTLEELELVKGMIASCRWIEAVQQEEREWIQRYRG